MIDLTLKYVEQGIKRPLACQHATGSKMPLYCKGLSQQFADRVLQLLLQRQWLVGMLCRPASSLTCLREEESSVNGSITGTARKACILAEYTAVKGLRG